MAFSINLLRGVVAVVGVLWLALLGGYAVFWYDRRPIDVPKPITVHVLWWSPSFGLPPSLAAQRDQATRTYRVAVQLAQARDVAAQRAYAAVSARADVAEQAAQQHIRIVTQTLKQDIPHVITPAVDIRYALPVGLIRVHDAAALGVDLSGIPAPTGLADDSPSPIEASRFAAVIADNYGEYRAVAERLTALQAWVRDTHAAAVQADNTKPKIE